MLDSTTFELTAPTAPHKPLHINRVREVRSATYTPRGATNIRADEDAIIRRAMAILQGRMRRTNDTFTAPEVTRDYLRLRISELPYEVFGMLFLDNRHRLIKALELFRGTIDGASVHPREVVSECLACNAAAVILYHNHPSGVAEPSQADLRITQRIKDTLSMIDVRVLDHMIVGEETCTSLAERGLI